MSLTLSATELGFAGILGFSSLGVGILQLKKSHQSHEVFLETIGIFQKAVQKEGTGNADVPDASPGQDAIGRSLSLSAILRDLRKPGGGRVEDIEMGPLGT
ncbi:uncharacterized protein PAC_11952 [Phialocephala subalpina]|uniref:Uncharacterized protein n=1 Tax=Phialocephala subalpina TaxID=576137 RepID=A0A1L7XAL1_9HELO|nr:uncharacterized protein PAC_11952 [Phialocephala subalpina]